ncbi:hypothetical protein LCGC14_0770950 [marine sediment metagenome]|uniref:Uncharacterized protein n=1 Tax=marine sediment metagenome TaxID=412755 RepID=A0A0F9QI34_9ZZZZ
MSLVQEGQNIFDIATENFGTLEQLFVLLNDNNLAVNAKLISGQELVINKINVGDENIKNFITLQNITLNNDQGEKEPPLLGGDYNADYGNDYN